MRLLKAPILILMYLMLAASGALASEILTLTQCIETGLKHNPALNAARFNAAAAGEEIKAVRSDFLPSLSSGYSVNTISSIASHGPTDADYLDQTIGSFNIRLSQILYAGNRIVNTYQKAKLSEQLAKTQQDFKALELAYQIEITFYGLMKAHQDLLITTESVNRLLESVKVAEAFFEKELIPQVEVLQARVDLADAKAQLGIAENNINRERIELYALMNLPPDADVAFVQESYELLSHSPSFDESFQAAMKNRPDIQILTYQLEIAEKEAAISMGKYLPVVRWNTDYQDQERDYDALSTSIFGSSDRDQRNRYWSTGIYAAWDMFDGGRGWYQKKKYDNDQRRILALMDDVTNTISTGIKKALFSMSEARERIVTSAEASSAALEYYAGEEHRLKAGISAIPALLEAQVRLVRAQGNETRALLDYQLATSELYLMTGERKPEEDWKQEK